MPKIFHQHAFGQRTERQPPHHLDSESIVAKENVAHTCD
jgi:hypothetical protein